MAKKLTKKELEVTSTLYQKYSAIDRRVHELNKAANRAFLEYIEVESALNKQRAKLEEKYGAVNIDLDTGELQEQPVQE